MELHEFDRLTAVTRRPAERERPVEHAPPLTMPTAMLSLQRLAGNESVSALVTEDEEAASSPVRQVVGSGGGSPIDSATRSHLEGRMGADFSDVRIHTGSMADHSARAINAQAYTVGTNVVFRSGAYQPETAAGQHVLAHELAHVIQQKAGPVAGTPAPGGISLSHPSDPFEQAAERAADQAVAGGETSPVATGAGEGPTAQRAAEEEEEVQTLPAQRQTPEEEEEPAA